MACHYVVRPPLLLHLCMAGRHILVPRLYQTIALLATQESSQAHVGAHIVLNTSNAGMQEGKAQGATAAKLAQQLDKRIFVGWPFLREAIIHAVADKSIKVLPQPPSQSGTRLV